MENKKFINKIIIASNNKGKISEFKEIFKNYDIKLLQLKELNIEIDIEETGKTFEENAYIKAKTIYNLTGLPTIADDSGLMIDFLNGEPGVFSARYAGENSTDKQKIDKILLKMKDAKKNERRAKFVCSIVFIFNNKESGNIEIIKSTGECFGQIAELPIGENGFGYDPIFMVNGKSFAQISKNEKNSISHRGKALKMLKLKTKELLK